ncbi:MAG: hypothetical protein ACOC1F_11515 [Myxococcota bacterium]
MTAYHSDLLRRTFEVEAFPKLLAWVDGALGGIDAVLTGQGGDARGVLLRWARVIGD